MPIRVLVADDHAIVLNGLQRLFESEPDFDVVRCCRDGKDALDAVRNEQPDVVVLDVRMPGLTGLDVLRTVKDADLRSRVVLLTAALDDEEIVEALRLGAWGLVLKESSPEALLTCVRKVYQGERWFDNEATTRAVGRAAQRASAASDAHKLLTPRELEIVQMISHGLRNKAIAERLQITEGTVKIHLHNVYEKAGVDGRLSLVLWAQEHGLA